jgi:hypothetical protein
MRVGMSLANPEGRPGEQDRSEGRGSPTHGIGFNPEALDLLSF